LGPCAAGTTTCSNGVWGPCSIPPISEICDDVDQDCDGDADELKITCYTDNDMDTWSPTTSGALLCPVAGVCPSTYTGRVGGGDCNDSAASTNPDATETIGDEVDQDCDGGEICYQDRDSDSYRDATRTIPSSDVSCGGFREAPASAAIDCNDRNGSIYPTATEVAGDEVDQNCDGSELCYNDGDNDGYRTATTSVSVDVDCGSSGEARASEPAGDCNDSAAAINPGASEVAGDEVDQNCDGNELCYLDDDNDGYRPGAGSATIFSSNLVCTGNNEARGSEPTGDCNDVVAAINPGATETIGDQVDYDCDGGEVCYADADNDGYRTAGSVASSDLDCVDSGEATASEPANDCQDGSAAINPGQAEYCDAVDQDCDGAPRNGCPDTATTSSLVYSPMYGSTTGTQAVRSCPANTALKGFTVWSNSTRVTRIQPVCQAARVWEEVDLPFYNYHIGTNGADTTLTSVGPSVSGVTSQTLNCPYSNGSNETPMAFIVWYQSSYVVGFQVWCQGLHWDSNDPLPWSTPDRSGTVHALEFGNSGGALGSSTCVQASRHQGAALGVRYDSLGIRALGIGCNNSGFTGQ
jgi:hypothetical protein